MVNDLGVTIFKEIIAAQAQKALYVKTRKTIRRKRRSILNLT